MKNSFKSALISRLPRLPQLLRWCGYAIGVILLLALLSWLTVPSLLKNTLEQQTETQIGRQLKVGEVTFNPLTLTLNLTNIVLYEPDKKTPALSVDKAVVKGSLTSLIYFAPVAREVVVTRPRLQLVLSEHDGQKVINFSDVINRLAQHPSKSSPMRFSVFNIQVSNGEIYFDDQIVGKKVQIEAIAAGVPFISSFSSKADVFVEPGLSARVNGALFEIKGRSKPFSETLETNLAINFKQFDASMLVPFSPTPLPFKVSSAKVSSNMELKFAMPKSSPVVSGKGNSSAATGKAAHPVGADIVLSGKLNLESLALSDFSNAPLFKVKSINIGIREANLIAGNMKLDTLEIINPEVWASLDQRGVLNWLALKPEKRSSALPVNTVSKPAVPFIELANFQLKNGTVYWSDAANAAPAVAMKFTDLNSQASHISTNDKAEAAKVTFSMGKKGQQQLHFTGTLNPMRQIVSGEVTLSDLALADYQPYFNRYLAANASGQLSLKSQMTFQNQAQQLKFGLNDFSGTLDDFKLKPSERESKRNARLDKGLTANQAIDPMSVKKMSINNLSLNSESKQVSIEKISINRAEGSVFREADGELNVMRLLKKPTNQVKNQVKNQAKKSDGTKKLKDWRADINQIRVGDSHFVFGDRAKDPVVTIAATEVEAKIEHVSTQFDRPVQLSLRAKLNKTGKLVVEGTATDKTAQLQVDAQQCSVVALQPYFTEFLNITLHKGFASAKGKLTWQAPMEVGYQGDLKVVNFASSDKETGNDFFKWTTLKIADINANYGEKQKNISLGHIDLSDFYVRVILSDKAKLNLQNILVHPQAGSKTVVLESSPGKKLAEIVPAPKSAATAPGKIPIVKVGQLKLNNGIINYTDNFIKPNYSVRMTGMTGTVGAIQSNVSQTAPVNIAGKIDNDAPIAISGTINPLFSPIMLDIKMTARGVDLPRLTTYSAKYAGYPIEKGKMSMDVEYHVKDNQLSANNSLTLDQLTFGNKVDSPDAVDLPIPFVVSLLTDRNGRINLDIPISGTLDDPEFSIGGLFFKALLHMIGKVFTSPFSLLAHSVAGAGELSFVEFDPGSAVLTDATKVKLDQLAKAMEEHPDLKLDIIGRADQAADTQGMRERRLARQIRKINELRDDESEAQGKSVDRTISEAERASAIAKIYSDGKFDKPRNKIGFAKSLPTAEMEKLIIDNTQITDDDLRKLAIRREAATRTYLSDTAHVPAERLYSVAPKVNVNDIKDKGSPSRVDFDLKM